MEITANDKEHGKRTGYNKKNWRRVIAAVKLLFRALSVKAMWQPRETERHWEEVLNCKIDYLNLTENEKFQAEKLTFWVEVSNLIDIKSQTS